MPTVLLCDDSLFARHMMRRTLEPAGYQVVAEAEDGEQAIIAYRAHRPDLLLVDLVMPGLNGTETIKRIIAEFPDARIIVCSAMGQDPLIQEAIDAGAKDYVLKPANPVRLAEVIDAVIRS